MCPSRTAHESGIYLMISGFCSGCDRGWGAGGVQACRLYKRGARKMLFMRVSFPFSARGESMLERLLAKWRASGWQGELTSVAQLP